jgi:uncharacterized protein
MEYTFHARGHPNVTSLHRSTFEITRDTEIGKTADCIVGVAADADLGALPTQIIKTIQIDGNPVKVRLETENASDEITGFGHPELTLNHPTDMVCRKSEFKCSRTLMIKADKAACDLKKELIADLKEGKLLKITITVVLV